MKRARFGIGVRWHTALSSIMSPPFADDRTRGGPATDRPSMTRAEGVALVYLALPTILFLAAWVVWPYGPIGAVVVSVAVIAALLPMRGRWTAGVGPMLVPVVLVAGLWTLLGGVGHVVYANLDWTVRDAVLVDLVRDPWPVAYRIDGIAMVLRAPIGYFLPAALVGKLSSVAMAEQALAVWTALGVALTFAMMLRDRPRLGSALIRIAIFVLFSGMDIVGTITHYKPHALGDHLEWWAFLFQYSSQTTQLFWVPNHALPGWLAIAWLVSQDPRRLSTTVAVLFVVFTPLWSPLTAIGLAPIVAVACVRRCAGSLAAWRSSLLDWRMVLPLVVCAVFSYPYLVAGSEAVASHATASVPWVGEDFVPRYIEFVALEFAGFALLLLSRTPRDPVLWGAVVVLLALPFYSFGPYNDLAMRGSIPALTLLAIEMGRWLSMPRLALRQRRRLIVAVILLAVGAVTPFMEFARVFLEPAWPLDENASVPDVTRGAHYLTATQHPWFKRFLAH